MISQLNKANKSTKMFKNQICKI